MRVPPSAAYRSFACKTCSTAMACRVYAASPSEAYALHLHLADAFILTLHSSYSFYILSALAFPGNRSEAKRIAMLYQLSYRKALLTRCAATASSTGGERTYRWAFAPSTWEKMACVLEWMRADWGADHVFTSCSCTSENKGTDILESTLRVDLKYHESSLLLAGSSGGLQVRQNTHELLEV